MRAIKTTTAKATFSPPIAVVHRSPWHSPVPYLFCGLAGMLGLISFSLLLLACSYWRLYSGDGEAEVVGAGQSTEKSEIGTDKNVSAVSEESLLVIMAGDVKPTYLATPAASSTCPCGNN